MKTKFSNGKLVLFDDLEKSILLHYLRLEKSVQIKRAKSSCYTLEFRALSNERAQIIECLLRKIKRL